VISVSECTGIVWAVYTFASIQRVIGTVQALRDLRVALSRCSEEWRFDSVFAVQVHSGFLIRSFRADYHKN
jgi:hypothetical protein